MTAVLLVAASALTVSCTRYVDAEPVASEALVGPERASGSDAAECAAVEAPLTDVEPLDDGEPVLRIPQPDGWERFSELDDDLFRFTMSNVELASADFAPTVVVTLESKSGIEDPSVVFEQQRASLEEGFGATELTVTETSLCGLPAERIEYVTPPIDPVGELPAQVLIAVMHTDNRTYAATVTTQTDNAGDPVYQDDTEQILGGFQMLAPAAG
jgi:hypothetical protein